MPNIRKEILKYLCKIAFIMVAAILIASAAFQVYNIQKKACEDSAAAFSRIEQIIASNEAEIAEEKEAYSRSCLYNAMTIARLIQADASVLESVEELKKIAEFTEVDEIHIFDQTGTIFAGTHPQFYNYSFDSGEQMMFFKPMLKDKSLSLVQDITPNTAENKLMQYSAIWSENGEFIVQVGMEPVNVMKATDKNELSYIFSLLRADPGVKLYAINSENNVIVGSTSVEDNGKTMPDIGVDFNRALNDANGFHTEVNGVFSFCIFTQIDSNYIGWIVPASVLYTNFLPNTLSLAAGLLFIAAILVAAVLSYTNRYVISGIYDINEKLRSISNGNLDEIVDVHSSLEFVELSSHINEMVRNLLANTDKISYVLNKTNLRVGVYEYNEKMQSVRFTECLPKILNVESGEASGLFSDHKRFRKFIDQLRSRPISDAENVYCINAPEEHFVKLDEVCHGNDIFGIVIDVTDEVLVRRKIEEERDIDPLTGLYSRRGLDNKLNELFSEPEKLGIGALIMIDADGLKAINDEYGHEMGDAYLKKISEVIGSLGRNSCIAARQGGDEFVVLLYHYPSEQELLESINTLDCIQKNSSAHLRKDLCVPLKFSFGYSFLDGKADYSELLKAADEKMYESKRARKKMFKPQELVI